MDQDTHGTVDAPNESGATRNAEENRSQHISDPATPSNTAKDEESGKKSSENGGGGVENSKRRSKSRGGRKKRMREQRRDQDRTSLNVQPPAHSGWSGYPAIGASVGPYGPYGGFPPPYGPPPGAYGLPAGPPPGYFHGHGGGSGYSPYGAPESSSSASGLRVRPALPSAPPLHPPPAPYFYGGGYPPYSFPPPQPPQPAPIIYHSGSSLIGSRGDEKYRSKREYRRQERAEKVTNPSPPKQSYPKRSTTVEKKPDIQQPVQEKPPPNTIDEVLEAYDDDDELEAMSEE